MNLRVCELDPWPMLRGQIDPIFKVNMRTGDSHWNMVWSRNGIEFSWGVHRDLTKPFLKFYGSEDFISNYMD